MKGQQQVTSSKYSLPLLNAETATFDCTFGRGCEGDCCTNGRPGLTDQEQQKISRKLSTLLPLLKDKARRIIEDNGLVTQRQRAGLYMAPVVDGWCVFFNEGCALHKMGAVEGDSLKYKPAQCAIFPLLWDEDGDFYVRQWNYKGEEWNDLHCLNPAKSKVKATESLKNEMNLALELYVKPQETRKAG